MNHYSIIPFDNHVLMNVHQCKDTMVTTSQQSKPICSSFEDLTLSNHSSTKFGPTPAGFREVVSEYMQVCCHTVVRPSIGKFTLIQLLSLSAPAPAHFLARCENVIRQNQSATLPLQL